MKFIARLALALLALVPLVALADAPKFPALTYGGYQLDLHHSNYGAAGTYPLGSAFPVSRFSFDGDGTFAGTLYACDTKAFVADTCDSVATLGADDADVIETARRWFVMVITTPAASETYLNIRGTDSQVRQGGGGATGTALLFQAYEAAVIDIDAQAAVTTTNQLYDLVYDDREYDPNDEWTVNSSGEICYDGTNTAQAIVEFTSTMAASADSPVLKFSIGKGTTGSLVEEANAEFRTNSNNYDGTTKWSWAGTLATNDCVQPMFGKAGIGALSSVTSSYNAVTIWAPGAGDGATDSIGGVTAPKVDADDFCVGRGQAAGGACAASYDTSAGAWTLADMDGGGGRIITEPPDAVGESWAFEEASASSGGHAVTIQTRTEIAGNKTVWLDAEGIGTTLWDSDTDASWGATEWDIEIGFTDAGGDVRLDDYRAIEVRFWGVESQSGSNQPYFLILDEFGVDRTGGTYAYSLLSSTGGQTPSDLVGTQLGYSVLSRGNSGGATDAFSCSFVIWLVDPWHTEVECSLENHGTVGTRGQQRVEGFVEVPGALSTGSALPAGITLQSNGSGTPFDMGSARAVVRGIR